MAKKYLDLVEIAPEFFNEVHVKVPVDFEEQAGSQQSFELLQNHLRSKKLVERIEEKISLKIQADKELAKVIRSMERNKNHIDDDIDMEDLSKHYIKLRALTEKLRLKIPDIERIENYPLMNIIVQQELMEKLKFNYEEETDLNSPLYEEMRNFTSGFVQAMKPLSVRPEMEDEEDDALMLAMMIMSEPEGLNSEELVERARHALSISRHCLPAYLVLLEEADLSDMEKYALSDKAIIFMEEFLGETFLKEFMGDISSSPEGDAYLRIRDCHARSLMGLEMYKEAVTSMQKTLEYDESDSFGLRYRLMTAFVSLAALNEARKLIFRFNAPDDVYWNFSKLLIDFLDKGENDSNLEKLKELKSKYPRVWELIQDEELNLSKKEKKLLRTDRDFELGYKYALWNQELWWDLEFIEVS